MWSCEVRQISAPRLALMFIYSISTVGFIRCYCSFFFFFFLQLVKCCIIKSNRCVQMLSLTEGLYFILCPSCCDCCLLFSSSLLFSQLMVSLHHPHVYISSPPLPFLYYLFLTCSPLVSRFSLALSLALSSLSTSISPPPPDYYLDSQEKIDWLI